MEREPLFSRTGARLDRARLDDAVARFTIDWTEAARDMEAYLVDQVFDTSHREIIGPLVDARGPSGVVRFAGQEVARWGDPTVPEMAFSATKSVLSMIAGVACDTGLLDPAARVSDALTLPEFDGPAQEITWEHLLTQTSGWEGTLWGKPVSVDAQSSREGTERLTAPAGEGWAYNDVRVNLLAYALTVQWRRPLGEVLYEALLGPLGASGTWAWHGYRDAVAVIDGAAVPVVSGGAHWGGGLVISAADFALLGQLYLDCGLAGGRRLLSAEWIERSWTPCPAKPEYGYLWWLNDHRVPWPAAPATGRGARGNGSRHLLWVDPARELVVCARWCEQVHDLLPAVSAAVT